MRPVSLLSSFFFSLLISCAHTAPDKGKVSVAPAPAPSPAPTGANRETPVPVEDADGDGVADRQDACPLDPGETQGAECPTRWGYFFLRVIDEQRLPIRAALAFQPAVNKMVVAEDGYSGVLRPGLYELRVEAAGFKPSDVTFEVLAEEKALVEVELQRLTQGSR